MLYLNDYETTEKYHCSKLMFDFFLTPVGYDENWRNRARRYLRTYA